MALTFGCQPDLGARSSSVEGLRLLAIQMTPAETSPGLPVSYAALLVDPNGERPDVPIDWAFCNLQKPLSELDDVAPECFTYGAEFLAPLGQGPTAQGKLPITGCSLFGPDVPPAMAGQPPGRPADPDLTGGYYQPVRLIVPDEVPLLGAGESRLVCGLPGATTDVLSEFKLKYKVNENPSITGVSVISGKEETALAPDDGTSSAFEVAAGKKITLRASWPACSQLPACGDGACSPGEAIAAVPNTNIVECPADCTTPKGCGGAEPYVYYDPVTRGLALRTEVLTLSWFATKGTFDADRSGLVDGGAEAATDNGFTAPKEAGPVIVWAVLRDDRGGVSWKRYRLEVK
ncbi:Hypothetical protein A7982_04861 [Minicystis rosea]|nr:Hypothetical protein A7982_04861 [Minicystis rosea]